MAESQKKRSRRHLGAQGEVHEGGDALLLEDVGLFESVALALCGIEGAILCGAALAPEGEGDLAALVDLGDVAGDSEEVSGVCALGEGACAALAVEGGDGIDDGAEGVACDGVEEVAFWVVEGEAREGVGECGADLGVLSGLSGLPGPLLLAEALAEGGPGGLDLVGRRLMVEVSLDAGEATVALHGLVVEGASPGGDDEADELPGELSRGGGHQRHFGGHLLEEAEATLDVGLVLGPGEGGTLQDGGSDGLGHGVGVVGGLVVQEEGDGRLTGGGDSVLGGQDDGGAVLGVGDGGADEGIGGGVHDQFEVEGEALGADGGPEPGAVADPLGVGEEGEELAAQGVLVG